MIGKNFGRLTVLSYEYTQPRKHPMYRCICLCGKEIITSKYALLKGSTKSCGCLHKEQFVKAITKHGKRYTRTYKIWAGIKRRCLNLNCKQFKYYGEIGIEICENWLIFDNFLKDMGECPEGLSIDRIDNNGSYCKENCRWATNKEQHSNRSDNIIITINNETHTMKEWAKLKNMNYNTLKGRINRSKWSFEKALTTPLSQGKKF